MSEKIRIGNTYYHDECGEVITTHHDDTNHIWYRGVVGKDNGGVISTTDWVANEEYATFLGNTTTDDYPDDWSDLAEVVRERDDNTCQGCGDEDAQLHVHHIVPLGCGGTNTLRNLITLCESCHGRVHGGAT